MQDKLRCAIYTRVSTDMQAEVEFNSCEAQEARIRAFIASQETMEIFRVYSDPGFTGANLNRPGLQELLEDVKQKHINLVITYKIDRLTRSPRDFYYLVEIFEKHGVSFISVTERFDTSTPSGRLLRNIMLTFAQFERELTSERVKDKMFERTQKGMWNGGVVPFGYKNESKRLIVNPAEAAVVKKMYEDYITTRSLVTVSKNLKNSNITYRKGNPFINTAIWFILRNAVYTGKVKYSGKLTPGNHEPIISQDMFDAAQAMHKTKGPVMKLYKDFHFSGLIHCSECGSIMTPHYTNKRKNRKLHRYYYYRCTTTDHNGWESCSTKQVSAQRLEEYIFENLKRISLDKQYIENMVFRINSGAGDRIGSFDSSKNIAVSGQSSGRTGLELSQDPPKISGEIFAQTLAAAVSDFSQKRGLERNLFCRRRFESIIYSKESIRLNLFARPPEFLPAEGFTSVNEKIPPKAGNFSDSVIQNGGPCWT